MDHRLSETQSLLRQSAADFFSQQYPLDRLRELQADRERRDPELWSALVGLGWTAAPFSQDIGGFPGSLLEAGPLLEEMGKAAYPSPYVHSCVASGLALADSTARTDLAAAVAAGDVTVSWCDRTRLVPPITYSDGKLSGRCLGVAWPELATHFLVRLADGAALVSADAAGVARRNLDSSGAESVGEVVFSGAVPSMVLNARVVDNTILNGAAGTAITLVGASQRALDLAVEYAKMRVQFGQPIGAFQSIQHKCANMVIDIDVARGLAYKAAAAHGTPDFARIARFSKAFAGDAARRTTREAIQIHGGVGFIDNHRVQLPYRLVMNLTVAYQSAGEHRRRVADSILVSSPAKG